MRTVLLLGVVSLLTDASSEMILPLLPVFLTEGLGARAAFVGFVEGAADLVAAVLKLLAGRWSDSKGRRKPFIVAGYALASAARPLVAFATSAWHVLLVRGVDRVGKGLRSAPRDALVASSVDAASRGAAFGLQRGMDHAGAVIGPLVAFALIAGGFDLRTIFLLAGVPAVLAVAVVSFVREAPASPPPVGAQVAPPARAWRPTVALVALATVGTAGDVFLVLKARAAGVALALVPWLWVTLHVGKALASWPAGRLGDRYGARGVLAASWALRGATLATLAVAGGGPPLFLAAAAHGVAVGLGEGPERALVAALGGGKRGRAFGTYQMAGGVAALAGGIAIGLLWDAGGPPLAFGAGAVLLVFAAAGLGLVR